MRYARPSSVLGIDVIFAWGSVAAKYESLHVRLAVFDTVTRSACDKCA